MNPKLKRKVQIIGHGVMRRIRGHELFLTDLTDNDVKIIRAVKNFTATTPERIYGLINAVRYVVTNQIPGHFVECGVWKGGSVMTMAKTLLELGVEREIYLFDTFAGMTAPTDDDKSLFDGPAAPIYEKYKVNDNLSRWSDVTEDEVRANVVSTGYNAKRLHFVVGAVEKTLPGQAPDQIALLRLDTDFYESTRVEMVHLYPRLSTGGVLLIDDYGHWDGARKAVDEYIAQNKIKLLLNRLDYSGRIGIKH